MERMEKLERLGRAFVYGETDELAELLCDDCRYYSDYAHRWFSSAQQILKNMREVYDAVQRDKEQDSTYTVTITGLSTLLKEDVDLSELRGDSFFDVYENGLLLYQYGDSLPAAVVFVMFTPAGNISEINLSRNHRWFDMAFYGENGLVDSEKDIPYTVKPMRRRDQRGKGLQAVCTHQKQEYEDLDDTEVYIWRQADQYFLQWLRGQGYHLTEQQIYDDCIGYRCDRKGFAYTIYLFAYGQVMARLDRELCKKLLDVPLSENSLPLVVFLHVKRSRNDDRFTYTVCNYYGDENRGPQLWRVSRVNDREILVFHPRRETMDAAMHRLMFAFNRDNMDVYDCIMTEKDPEFTGFECPGSLINEAFFANMFRLHREHGDMKIGYVRFDHFLYNSVPYIDGYGYFDFRVNKRTGRIHQVTACPLDSEKKSYTEFIQTDERENDAWYGNVPQMTGAEVLPPAAAERFALKLFFDNGECRKFVLPIDSGNEYDEAVSYKEHVFTDNVWSTAQLKQSADPHRGRGIEFSNGFFLSALECYEEGESYTEPVCCDETVFEDETLRVKRLWTWNATSVSEDEETGLLRVSLSGQKPDGRTVSTFASHEGKRLSSISFDEIGRFHEGLARVFKDGFGYGYMDKDMRCVIPMRYRDAGDFRKDKALVRDGERWFYIDRKGRELPIEPVDFSKYQEIGEYGEGMCKVSALKLGFMDLAHYSENSQIAGIWGFVDENGQEVIRPQYIYAEDFFGGAAIVCKGKWTRNNSGRYWTEEERWGAVDKKGETAIPFIFDEIRDFEGSDDVVRVHCGGWENGHWGVMDKRGNWLADPVFADIDDLYHDGLFAFFESDDEWEEDRLMGIYDLKQKKVLFQPQFFDVRFSEDGWIKVEVHDERLGQRIEKFIDRSGKEKFRSIYTSIDCWKKPYEVRIRDENGVRDGLIDENGNVILPCEYDFVWPGADAEHKRIVYRENGKVGVMDFEGNTLIEPRYSEIYGLDKPLITVRIGNIGHDEEGLVTQKGAEVVPPKFKRIIWCKQGYFICCTEEHCEMMRCTDK